MYKDGKREELRNSVVHHARANNAMYVDYLRVASLTSGTYLIFGHALPDYFVIKSVKKLFDTRNKKPIQLQQYKKEYKYRKENAK